MLATALIDLGGIGSLISGLGAVAAGIAAIVGLRNRAGIKDAAGKAADVADQLATTNGALRIGSDRTLAQVIEDGNLVLVRVEGELGRQGTAIGRLATKLDNHLVGVENLGPLVARVRAGLDDDADPPAVESAP